MPKKSLIIILLYCFMFAPVTVLRTGANASLNETSENDRIIVTDHLNRKVKVVQYPKRIISLHPIATQIIYLLNSQDRMIAFDNMSASSKWVHRIDTDWTKRKVMTFGDTPPNIEAVAAMRPDIVIQGAYFPSNVEQVSKVAAVVAFDFHLKSADDAVELIGKAIGKGKRARELNRYLDKKKKEITGITGKIPDKKRPTVFYQTYQMASGGLISLKTCGNKAYQHRLINDAGGINIGKNYPVIWQSIDNEILLKWQPDIMFMRPPVDGQKNITLQDMENDPIFSRLSFVMNRKFYLTPYGEFSSTVDAPEGIIGLQFMAKKLHPDLFAWLNLENEIQEFYYKWYSCRLTSNEINQILNK